MAKNMPLHLELNRCTGIVALTDNEDLFYNDKSITLITHRDLKLEHLKAVYEIGVDELLKGDYFVYQKLPEGYTISDFIRTLKEEHNHTQESLQRHLKSLVDDTIKVLNYFKGVENE